MQTSWKPVPKMVATALGGALAVLIFWLLTLFQPEIIVPPPVVAALTTILAFLFGYLKAPSDAELHAELMRRQNGEAGDSSVDLLIKLVVAVVLIFLLFKLLGLIF